MEISFAWTTPALMARAKSVTRRDWNDDYAARFREGMEFTALNRQRRYKGSAVARIRLTGSPYKESTLLAPPEDWYGEGFDYLERIGAKVDKLPPSRLWRVWHTPAHAREMWVVRFELVEFLVPHEHWCPECLSRYSHIDQECQDGTDRNGHDWERTPVQAALL